MFYADMEELGRFERVSPEQMPPDYRLLLAHENHMTVTMERFHASSVKVHVLAAQTTGSHYSRKILLSRTSDDVVVQFGIVRINFNYLGDEVRREIESQRTPLGRILINHGVLREVELWQLWRVAAGPDLQQLFSLSRREATYGRTALIHCNGEPAIELLEIATPTSPSA